MSTSTELKNVLVVGLGLSGAPAVNALAQSLPPTHRIVAISATCFAYYSIAALRSIVVPSWADKSTLPLDSFFPKDSRHVVLSGTSVVELRKNSVLLDSELDPALRHLGTGREIKFEYAVVATGSTYAFPCRPPTEDSTVAGVVALFRSTQAEIEAAKSVLIVGGGPVGIEFAGEVKAAYKDKAVTLVHSGKVLLEGDGFKESLGKSLLDQLVAMGVKVVFGKRLDTHQLTTGKIEEEEFDLGADGSVKGENDSFVFAWLITDVLPFNPPADFLMVAYGNSPNTSLIADFDPTLLSASKRVLVKNTFQLPSTDGSLDHIFAIGDITEIPETKLWYNAQNHGPLVAKNIGELIKGKKATYTYSPGAKLIVVSVGPSGGAGQLFFGVVVGAWATAMAKSKTLFLDKFRMTFNA